MSWEKTFIGGEAAFYLWVSFYKKMSKANTWKTYCAKKYLITLIITKDCVRTSLAINHKRRPDRTIRQWIYNRSSPSTFTVSIYAAQPYVYRNSSSVFTTNPVITHRKSHNKVVHSEPETGKELLGALLKNSYQLSNAWYNQYMAIRSRAITLEGHSCFYNQ